MNPRHNKTSNPTTPKLRRLKRKDWKRKARTGNGHNHHILVPSWLSSVTAANSITAPDRSRFLPNSSNSSVTQSLWTSSSNNSSNNNIKNVTYRAGTTYYGYSPRPVKSRKTGRSFEGTCRFLQGVSDENYSERLQKHASTRALTERHETPLQLETLKVPNSKS
jgi:hypothetical protein